MPTSNILHLFTLVSKISRATYQLFLVQFPILLISGFIFHVAVLGCTARDLTQTIFRAAQVCKLYLRSTVRPGQEEPSEATC